MKKSLFYALIAIVCFSSTYIINRLVSLGDADWRWNASLRHFIILFILGILLLAQKKVGYVLSIIAKNPWKWLLWSTVGFGFFYAFLTYGSFYGESWLAVGVWQITIIAGTLMTPLFFHQETQPDGSTIQVRNKIPKVALCFSLVILAGVFLLQLSQAKAISFRQSLQCIIPITIAAFSYILGNRKTMELTQDSLTATQRVFAMTLCSLPFWLLLSASALLDQRYPTWQQTQQVAIVAVFSGCIATSLFFKATTLVRDNPKQLSVIESTVAGEIPVTLFFGVAMGISSWPDFLGFLGLIIIIIGMVANSIVGARVKSK